MRPRPLWGLAVATSQTPWGRGLLVPPACPEGQLAEGLQWSISSPATLLVAPEESWPFTGAQETGSQPEVAVKAQRQA